MIPPILLHRGTTCELLADLLLALDGDDLPRDRRDRARAAVKAARWTTVSFLSPRAGEFVIDGVRVHPGLVGVDAAWCTIAAPGQQVVRAADFAVPGATQPATAMRAALKRAGAFLEPYHAGLADAVRSIRVVRGYLLFKPTGRLDIATK